MPTLVYQIAAGQDDGHYKGSSSYCGRGDGTVWLGGTDRYRATFRFTGVALNSGMRITAARLYLRASWNYEYTLSDTHLGCDDADDAANLVTTCDAASRSMTTAYTDWTEVKIVVMNTWYWSPDFAASVREVVARPGWASGNHLAVLAIPQTPVGTAFQSFAYETLPASSAKLYVTYADLVGGAML